MLAGNYRRSSGSNPAPCASTTVDEFSDDAAERASSPTMRACCPAASTPSVAACPASGPAWTPIARCSNRAPGGDPAFAFQSGLRAVCRAAPWAPFQPTTRLAHALPWISVVGGNSAMPRNLICFAPSNHVHVAEVAVVGREGNDGQPVEMVGFIGAGRQWPGLLQPLGLHESGLFEFIIMDIFNLPVVCEAAARFPDPDRAAAACGVYFAKPPEPRA